MSVLAFPAKGLDSMLDRYAPTPQEMWGMAIGAQLTPIPIASRSKKPASGYLWTSTVPDVIFPHGTQSVGIRCHAADSTAALDFDCDCGRGPQYLAALNGRLGNQIAIRFGRPGRFLLPIRTQGPFEAHDFKLPCGCTVQLLACEKYFVAAGLHEKTGEPYSWINLSSPWPVWSYVQALGALAYLGTDVTGSKRAEVATINDITKATPQSVHEKELIRTFALARLTDLTNELRGIQEYRGSLIFKITAVLAPAVEWGCISQSEIGNAVEAAGHSLNEGHGGRTLGEEITRGLADPVRVDNPVLSVALRNREFYAALAGTMPDGRTSLDKIMDTAFEPLRFVVQDILPEGLIFLVGDPKVGKSFIVLELVLSVAEGSLFWGRECAQGDVLYFMLEDSPRRVKRRVEALRPSGHAKGKIHVFTQSDNIPRISLQPGIVGFLERLETFLDENPKIKLVVIDTLINIRPDKRDRTQGLYQSDYESVAGLQRLIARRGITCVCVHHTRKSAEVDSIAERISGSNGLHGGVDGAWFVVKKNGAVMFSTSMRDVEDIEMPLTKAEGALVWKPEGDFSAPAKQPKSFAMQLVAGAVLAGGCEATPADIELRTKLPREKIRVYLHRLEDRGDLERASYGLYKIRGSTPKTRPEGARDLIVNAMNGGTYPDFQAGKVVDVVHVLPHLKDSDRAPVTQGCAIARDAAIAMLSMFHDPDTLVKSMENRKLATTFDKVLLIPHSGAPVALPWLIPKNNPQKMPWDA
jgi:AAA domain